MKRHEPSVITLRWPGSETLKSAREAMRSGAPVEIDLPLEVHYALYSHLHGVHPGAGSEDIDVTGGAELLARIGTVAGLEELAGLEPAARRAHYRIRLTSPEPCLRLVPPA